MVKAKTSHLLALIPLGIAFVVGVMQIYLAFSKGLSAWQVGGFGMFARPDMKYLRVYVEEMPIDPASDYGRLIKKIDTLPTEKNLQLLASVVACDYGGTASVELWRARFDTERQRVDFWQETRLEKSCD